MAVRERLLALSTDGAALRRRREIAAVLGNLNEARIKPFARTVGGEMQNLWGGERVGELARTVEPLDGEVFDDRIGIVPGGLCVPARAIEHCVLQPQGQQPEKRHQNEREQRSYARFHASWRARARSSVSWAPTITPQPSPPAPPP